MLRVVKCDAMVTKKREGSRLSRERGGGKDGRMEGRKEGRKE